MEDVGVNIYVNRLSVPFFFVPALAIALYVGICPAASSGHGSA